MGEDRNCSCRNKLDNCYSGLLGKTDNKYPKLEVTNRSYAHSSVSKKLPCAATNVKFEYEYVLGVSSGTSSTTWSLIAMSIPHTIGQV